jgi:hypothetical protein
MREIHASATPSLHRYASQGEGCSPRFQLSIINYQLFRPISKITRLPVRHSFSGGGRASATPNYHAWTGMQVENSTICV